MKILIVGGGIAGLTLAGLLQQRGEHPVVIEKASSYGDHGYVLSLWSLGNRVLHGLHRFEQFRAVSVPLDRYTIANARGHALRTLRLREQFGEMRTLRRGDLIALLQSAAGGIPVRFDTTVQAVTQNAEVVEVVLSDGTRAAYDLVVGADGIHSEVRRRLFGVMPLHDMGWHVWWWWQALPTWPRDQVQEMWGARRFLGIYPVPDEVACAAVLPNQVTTPTDDTARRAFLQRSLRGYGGQIGGDILTALATAHIEVTPLADIAIPTWSLGRVILIGDAAAAFLPTAGIGASVAMESAAVLNDELSRIGAAQVTLALTAYTTRRRTRVDALQHASRQLARIMFPSSSLLAWGRNQAVRILPEKQLFGSWEPGRRDLSNPIAIGNTTIR